MIFSKVYCELFQKYKVQIFAVLAVNILTFSHGHSVSWSATALPVLQSDDSPLLSGPINVDEASWIGSLVCAGGLMGNFIFGILMNQIGRKKVLLIAVIPHLCTWFMHIFGNLVWHLYIARILSGLTGGCLYVTIPTFIADIADNKIRGTLGSSFIFVINGGMLSGYILGSYLSYSLFPRVVLGFSILYVIAIFKLPDTPQFLIKIKKYKEAEESLKFYKNFKGTSKVEREEFDEYLSNLRKTIEGSADCKREKLSYREFVKPDAIKGVLIGLGLVLVNQLSGVYAVTLYTANLFQMSGSDIDPNTSTIIVGAVQLLGTFISVYLVDRIGRKILLAVSSGGVALGSIGAALFSYYSRTHDLTAFSWFAVASVSLSILLGSVGLIPLPYVVLTEILPQRVKATYVTFVVCTLSIIAFTILKIYPILLVNIGLDGVMWISATVTIVGTVLIILFLPETKGKSLEKSDDVA